MVLFRSFSIYIYLGLGTFAVLIRAGMEMKQSFLWIFISACFLYPGLVIGAILGDTAEDASPYIFALAGGMFLYMALVDVMKEMNHSMENALKKGLRSGLNILALQNLGIILAIIILSVLALYEQDMDFEQVELRELTDNALQWMKIDTTDYNDEKRCKYKTSGQFFCLTIQ